jgi:hypothetical protein
VAIERGADSDSVGLAGNQVEHAEPSQVNAIRSSNFSSDRMGSRHAWEGLGFPLLR